MPVLASAYAALGGAIVFELLGTSLLQKSEQFSRTGPTLGMALSYALCFYLLSLALKQIPLGVAYAIWAGVGIVFTAVIGVVVFRQPIDMPAIAGIGFIALGVVLLNGFSSSMSH